MSQEYGVTMRVRVFDRPLMMKVAREHAARNGTEHPTEIKDVRDALIMLLDPGGGGDAYQGNLNEAGIQIEETLVHD